MRHIAVVPLVVAESTVRFVLDECPDLAAPGGCCGAVGFVHVLVVVR